MNLLNDTKELSSNRINFTVAKGQYNINKK